MEHGSETHEEKVVLHDVEPTPSDFQRDLLTGLQNLPKWVPCKYLYDDVGADLFEQICGLEEYYPTRVETSILKGCLNEIVSAIGPNAVLVDLGSGSSAKTELLLSALEDCVAYIPIDISKQQLIEVAHDIRRRHPRTEVLPVCADYHKPLKLPTPTRAFQRTVFFFPGSTIGNFEPGEVVSFLKRFAVISNPGDAFLLGMDLQKERSVMESAYNDPRGITARFIKNILARANRELQAGFDLDAFRHRAFYNAEAGRVENQLVSTCRQTITLAGVTVNFEPNEPVTVEHSYKYTLGGFQSLIHRSGYRLEKVWMDEQRYFSVQYLLSETHGDI